MLMRATGPAAIEYPDSDGQRMADNTLQADWIAKLKGNLEALFLDRPDVFVAMDLLWYPVEGEREVRAAPDVLAAFGRPKGYRGSYKQWEEDDVPVTVAIEILSPSNSYREMIDKFIFYEEHGVEEYYVFDPDANRLEAYTRKGDVLVREPRPNGYVSPRLKVRFDLSAEPEMVVRYPNGDPFLPLEELKALQEHDRRRADAAEKLAGDEKKRADRLAELSGKLLRGQLTPHEAAELRRLAGG